MENQLPWQECLSAVKQIPGVLGGILLQKRGEVLGHSFDDAVLFGQISRLARDYLRLIPLLAREGRTGLCHSLLLKGDFGMIYFFMLHSRKWVKVTLGNDSMNIGLLRATLEEEFSKLN